MIYEVKHDGKTTYIQAKPHRAHYVAQRVAGWRMEEVPAPDSSRVLVVERVPNPYTLEPLGRVKAIRAANRRRRESARFKPVLEGGEAR